MERISAVVESARGRSASGADGPETSVWQSPDVLYDLDAAERRPTLPNADLAISGCIDRLCTDFVDCPNTFLTEDDMRMHLGSLLLAQFATREATEDGDLSISLHSEVRWYGNGSLKYRSDLVLFDVSSLRVIGSPGVQQLPSKGYSFDIPRAIIELKLRRPNGDSDRAFIGAILDDCSKLNAIRSELWPEQRGVSCWVLAFDKKADISAQLPPGGEEHLVYKWARTARQVHGDTPVLVGR